jgi:DNA-binding NtrC family response regulator
MIREGRFREDLFYRLAVITLKLPPLRERRTDIVAIAERLLAQINADFAKQEPGYKDKSLSAFARAFVVRHPWSGNVRELYNALIQAAVMTDDPEIHAEDLSAATVERPSCCDHMNDPSAQLLGEGFSLEAHLISIQKQYLRRAMQEAEGIKAKAARLLGMKNYQTLDAQLKRFGIDWQEAE